MTITKVSGKELTWSGADNFLMVAITGRETNTGSGGAYYWHSTGLILLADGTTKFWNDSTLYDVTITIDKATKTITNTRSFYSNVETAIKYYAVGYDD